MFDFFRRYFQPLNNICTHVVGVPFIESSLIMPLMALQQSIYNLIIVVPLDIFSFSFLSVSHPVQCLFFSATFPSEVCTC